MPVDEDFFKKKAAQKIFEEKLEAMRLEALKNTSELLAKQEVDIEKHASQYVQERERFIKISDDRRQQVGSESFPILFMQMGPSLLAFSNMMKEYKLRKLNELMHFMSENFNTRDFTPMAGLAELTRYVQAVIEDQLAGPVELPPVFVPYLAEVDENGVLSIDVSLPDLHLTQQEAQDLQVFKAAVEDTVTSWIERVEDNGNPLYAIEDVPNQGKKIRIRSSDNAAPRYLTKREFRELRTKVIEPQLKAEHGLDFQHDAPANFRP